MKRCPVCVKEIPDDAHYCGYDVSTGIAPVRKKSENRSGRHMGGVVLIVLGLIFLVSAYTDYDFGQLWPLLLIAIGVVVLFRKS
jgi:predicted nucleic acid-binding Zn ribbon protein